MSEYEATNLDDVPADRFKGMFHGAQGKGKTTLAASIAEKCKTVLIDLPGEKGIKSIRGMGLEKNLKIIRPTEIAQLDDIFWDLQTDSGPVKGAEAVILESAGAYQKMVVRMLMGNPENKVRSIDKSVKMVDQQTWGKVGEFMSDLATFWYGLADATSPSPKHIIMTSQSRVTEDEETGEIEVTLDVTPASRAVLLAAPDYIGYCFVERDMEPTDDPLEENWNYCVRFGPHDSIVTKIHENLANAEKFPSVLGRKSRLTIPKLLKALDIPIK